MTASKDQTYVVRVKYEQASNGYSIDNVIDWKLEDDIYYFFYKVGGQLRPALSTQWLKAPGLISVSFTPVGVPVPYPSEVAQ
jgi:hypothetical protein